MSRSETKKPLKGATKKMLPTLRRQLEEERVQLLEHARQLEADFRDESWKEILDTITPVVEPL